jgi:hypothetical protein
MNATASAAYKSGRRRDQVAGGLKTNCPQRTLPDTFLFGASFQRLAASCDFHCNRFVASRVYTSVTD